MRRSDRKITDPAMIEEILSKGQTCYLSLLDEEYPYTVPLSYGHSYEDGELVLYFHSAPEGKKLELIRKNPKVSFCIAIEHGLTTGPQACNYSFAYQSIMGHGEMSILTDPQEISKALDVLMRHHDKEIALTYPHSMLQRTAGLKLQVKEYSAKANLRR